MKTIKRRILTTMLAMLLTIISIAAFGFGKRVNMALALSEDYHGEPDTIYYFFDYYPSTTYSAMSERYPEYNIVYDRNIVDNFGFINMVTTGYFNGFGEHCMVIIDIKSFVPDVSVLEQLFRGIKGQHSGEDACSTTFITIADDGYYGNVSFTQYVDKLIYTDFCKLDKFLDNTVAYIEGWYKDYYVDQGNDNSNLCILVDGNTRFNRDHFQVSGNEPFIDKLIDKLTNNIGQYLNPSDVSVLVNTAAYHYVSVFGANTVVGNYDDVQGLMQYSSCQCVCAIGFWELEQDFYDLLRAGQQDLSADYLPVYLLGCDPFNDTGSGLVCTFPDCLVDMESEIFEAIDNWKN